MADNILKVMSFNLRYDNPHDGINSFTNRKELIRDVILKESPDIVGFQEVTDNMRKYLIENVPGYSFSGCGRNSDYHGEAMVIGYKTAENEIIKLDNFWLSPTPDIPGSRFDCDQGGCPRMATLIYVKNDKIDKPFCFINTHLDCDGKQARYLGAMEILQRVSSINKKVIITGDFNAEPSEPEIKIMTTALLSKKMTDMTAGLTPTFHGFGLPYDKRSKIDYIFSDGKLVSSYAVNDEGENGIYYSDHNAVVAFIDLT